MHPKLAAAAAGHLEAAGVTLVMRSMVKSIAPGRVTLEGPDGPQELQAATICWTAGVRASRLGALLAERTDCPVDRGGRLLVEPDFSMPGHPEIHAVGDLCSYIHTADGRPLPGMAGPAVQMGGWVAPDPGPQQGRRNRPLPLDRPGQHGRDRPLLRGGRPAGPPRDRPGGLGAVGPGPSGLHPRHGEPHLPVHQVDVADRHPPAHRPTDHRPPRPAHRCRRGPLPRRAAPPLRSPSPPQQTRRRRTTFHWPPEHQFRRSGCLNATTRCSTTTSRAVLHPTSSRPERASQPATSCQVGPTVTSP